MDLQEEHETMPQEPDETTVDRNTVARITATVLARLARRRRRIRAAKWSGIGLTTAALLALALWALPRQGPSREDKTAEPAPLPAPEATVPAREGSAVEPDVERRARPTTVASPSPRRQARDLWRDALVAHATEREAGGPGAEALAGLLAQALSEVDSATLKVLVHDVRRGALSVLEKRSSGFTGDLLWALGRSERDRAWPILEAAFDTLGPLPAAIWAAGEMGETRAVPLLRRLVLLGDRRGEAAAAALRKIPGREALEALLAVAEGTRGGGELLFPDLAREIEQALREREMEISSYLLDSEKPRRSLAIKALFEIGSPTALASLVRALEDPECRAVARHYLVRAARQDLGPRPDAWQRWLAEETKA